MATTYMSFRVCVYPSPDEKGYFVAHCLELDVIGEGKSIQEAVSILLEAIETQIEICKNTGSQLAFFAPEEVWQKYNQAKKLSREIPVELVERIVSEANKRLGHETSNMFNDVVRSTEIPDECLMSL